MLREAIEHYMLWRRAHGAKFTTGASLLRRFLDHADGDAACDAVTTAQVLAYLAGEGPPTRHRENKYYALAGFWRYAISRGHASRSPLPDNEPRSPVRPPPYIYSRDELATALRSRDRAISRHGAGPTGRGDVPDLACPAVRGRVALRGGDPPYHGGRRSANAVLTIRATKFYKSRLVPVGPQLAAVLDSLHAPAPASRTCARPERVALGEPGRNARSRAAPFRPHSTRCGGSRASAAQPGGRDDAATARPAAQLRGSSADRLVSRGRDVQRLLPVLSTYLGHADLEGTKVYLSMTPELLQQASLRFERYARGRRRCLTLSALGPWLRRFLGEHIVTERNLARNTQKSYSDTFSLLLPFVSRKLRKPVDRLAVGDLTSRTCAAVPRASRRESRLLRPDPQSAAGRHPGLRPLRRQPRSGPCRMVRSHPRHSRRRRSMPQPVGWLTRAEMEAHARDPRPQDAAGPERICASAVPLQHRGAGLRSHPAESARPADRSSRRPRSRDPARERRQDAPVPAMAGNRARLVDEIYRSRGE